VEVDVGGGVRVGEGVGAGVDVGAGRDDEAELVPAPVSWRYCFMISL